jgi:hypothetical protein
MSRRRWSVITEYEAECASQPCANTAKHPDRLGWYWCEEAHRWYCTEHAEAQRKADRRSRLAAWLREYHGSHGPTDSGAPGLGLEPHADTAGVGEKADPGLLQGRDDCGQRRRPRAGTALDRVDGGDTDAGMTGQGLLRPPEYGALRELWPR